MAMKRTGEMQSGLNLESGWLGLDFVNTALWHASDSPEESLVDYNALIAWGQDRRYVDKGTAKVLHRLAVADSKAAEKVYRRAIDLRESLFHLFAAIAGGKAPSEPDFAILNDNLPQALSHLRIAPAQRDFAWNWRSEPVLDSPLWPVTWSAATLLTSREVNRLGICADDRGCGWLYIDLSRNHSRRWCDMNDCGNRNKVRRYYARHKETGPTVGQGSGIGGG